MKTTTTAQQLGVSQRALDLCLDADVIDLHVDTFIPVRLWGYDVLQHHGRGTLNGYYFGHVDLPRMDEQGVTGAIDHAHAAFADFFLQRVLPKLF